VFAVNIIEGLPSNVGAAAGTRLHDLILSQAAGVLGAFHGIAVALVGVLDEL
jgi:hypothetical protein